MQTNPPNRKMSRKKSTKRFDFRVSRNPKSHQTGANTVTISTGGDTERYSGSTTSLTMTVREAQALQSFLNENLSYGSEGSDYIS